MATAPPPSIPSWAALGLGRKPAIDPRELVRGAAEGAFTGALGGPVDLATMALRPLGYDLDRPVMGSEWIRDRLTDAGVYQPRTGSVGEQVGEFGGALAAPGPDPAQYAALGLGGIIRAYHGSPHTFEKFDLGKIGTGEGAQAYGHGLYFAESPGVAKSYKDALSNRSRNIKIGDRVENPKVLADELFDSLQDELDPLTYNGFSSAFYDLADGEDVVKNASQRLSELNPYAADGYRRAAKLIADKGAARADEGATYTVDLDVEPEDLLDWDKPLSEQSEKVRQALESAGYMKSEGGKTLAMHESGAWVPAERLSGQSFYQARMADALGEGAIAGHKRDIEALQPNASAALRAAGIPGIRYLDQGSRASGEGTRNFVMFSDELARILERNGQP